MKHVLYRFFCPVFKQDLDYMGVVISKIGTPVKGFLRTYCHAHLEFATQNYFAQFLCRNSLPFLLYSVMGDKNFKNRFYEQFYDALYEEVNEEFATFFYLRCFKLFATRLFRALLFTVFFWYAKLFIRSLWIPYALAAVLCIVICMMLKRLSYRIKGECFEQKLGAQSPSSTK